MSNLENETNQNNLSDIIPVKNETTQLDDVKSINSLINIQVDEIFKKKVNFLGLMQQIFGVISIIGGVIWCLSIVGVLFGSQFLDIIIKFIIGILSIMIGIKSFKSGNAYKKSMLTLEGNDLKNGLTIYSDVMKFTLILYIVSFLFYIMIIIRIVSIL
ncbi:MAG: hypothetical protein KBA67_08270 [Leptotrichiaceae bacterium]|jgi:hypothetical protein|nr:hypothetical protein [Leptotrichiaceae bacterium]